MRISSAALKFRDLLTAAKIEFFLPTTKTVVKRGEKEEAVEKPLLFSYIFVRAEESVVNDFTAANDGVVFLRQRTSDGSLGQHLVVPDFQMKNFIRAVEQYTGDIPFVAPTADMLSKGDRVRIIGGPFKDIEGILEARQGKDGGRVIVRIGDLVAVPTVEISPEFIEVLEFAPEGKHLYQKLDSFQPRLLKAIRIYLEGEPVPPELEAHLKVFIRRFANLSVPALNAKVRFLCYLMLAYLLTEHGNEHATPVLKQILELQPALKSESTKRLVEKTLSYREKIIKMQMG